MTLAACAGIVSRPIFSSHLSTPDQTLEMSERSRYGDTVQLWPPSGPRRDWPPTSRVDDRPQEASPRLVTAGSQRSRSIEQWGLESSSDEYDQYYGLSATPAPGRHGQSTTDTYRPGPRARDPVTQTIPKRHRPSNADIVQSEYKQPGILTD